MKNLLMNIAAPPQQPMLKLTATTCSSVQVSWRTGSNGGSKIQGFDVYHKREHSEWRKTQVGASNRSYVANALRCGSRYSFYVRAVNQIGEGIASEIVNAQTNGSGTAAFVL